MIDPSSYGDLVTPEGYSLFFLFSVLLVVLFLAWGTRDDAIDELRLEAVSAGQ